VISPGSARARFQRAIDGRQLVMAEMGLRELQWVSLKEALELVVLYAHEDSVANEGEGLCTYPVKPLEKGVFDCAERAITRARPPFEEGEGDMTKTRKTASAAASLGLLTSAALVALIIAAATTAAPQAAPANVDPPTITGIARVGEVLTAHNGTWDNAPTEFRYRWLRCNANGFSCILLTADGQTFRLHEVDVGHTLRVRVTAINADGATNARSEPSDVVASNAAPLTNTALPTIMGTPRVGEELTANEGTWTGNPTSFSFQWQRCDIDAVTCVSVIGATGRTYGVRLADLGFRLRVQVTARTERRVGTATSALTAVVQPTVAITNRRPTIRILGVVFTGARIYVRFRVCDDQPRNLAILVRETRPGVRPALRRFATRVPPRPCGAYTRSWLPAQRFRGPGRYTITLRARDVSGFTSFPVRRTFVRR
jgi:hypothetical protein